jgi:Fe2+ or Zn2+ uptake regulation protein
LLFCHRCSTILCDQTVANHAAEHASDSKQPQQHTIMYRAAKNHFICVECDKVIDVPMYLKKLRPWCDKIHANLREVRKNNQARGGKAMFKGELNE